MSDEEEYLQQLHKLLQDLLPCDSVKAYCVLGNYEAKLLNNYRYFLKSCDLKLPLIEWIGNLMTLAGAFLYAKFNKWRADKGAHPTDTERPNALYLKRLLAGIQSTDVYFDQASSGLRILRVLDGLYDNFDMNFSVIKYLIINLQIEMGFNFQDKEQRGLSRLIRFPDEESLRITCNHNDPRKKGGQNLAAAFNYVSIYRNDPDLGDSWDRKYNNKEVWSAFGDVLKTMDFMKRVKLDIDSEGNVNFKETTSSGEEEIPSHGVVRIFKKAENNEWCVYKGKGDDIQEFNINFFLLERIEYLSDIAKSNAAIEIDDVKGDTNTISNAAVRLLYQSFNESNSVSVYFSEKEGWGQEGAFPISLEKSAADYFKRVSGYLPYTRSTAPFFRGMITTHYRYFNILAPSIVDAIDTDLDVKIRVLEKIVGEEALFKEALEPAFKIIESVGEVFPKDWKGKIEKLCEHISEDEDKDSEYHFRNVVDWDAIILRILIYEGPSEILKTVLLHDEREYLKADKNFIKDTCKKIIAGLEMRYIDNIFEASEVVKNQEEHYKKIGQPRVDKLKDYYHKDYIFKMECKVLAQSYIDTIISELTLINEGDMAKDKFSENSIQDTLEILEAYKKEKEYSKAYKVFLKTIKTFLSFYAGIRKSCSSRMSYEFEKSTSILQSKEIEKKKNEIMEKFFIGVSEKVSELSKHFNDANADAVKYALTELWELAHIKPEEIKYYKAVLGRAPIDAEKLAKVFCVHEAKKIIFMPREREEKKNFEQVKDQPAIIKYLENVMQFLAGEMDHHDHHDNDNRMDYKEHIKVVVYPQVVTFAKQHEDGDANNCLVMNHSGEFAYWHKSGVQILTEFKYTINNSYYALPNINSIDTEWWVEPILIPCNKFDEEIRKASADKEDLQ